MHSQSCTFRIQAICSAAVMAIAALAGIPSLYGNDWAFTGVTPGGHRGPVSALLHKNEIILSAGEDGFLETWNVRDNASLRGAPGDAVERFQISPYRITALAGRPEKDEVCVVENDGMGLCRVSAWNYKERRNFFSLQFRDPIVHLSYSMGGSFIIAAGTGRTGLVLINADTGAMLQPPSSLTGTVSFALTGRSERNMLTYSPSGSLSYWDMESGKETNHFDAPPNLYSPVLFSNNRYLAGVNAEGLAVIHAVTGELLARENSVPDASLLCPAGDDLYCLIQKEKAAAQLRRYTIDRNGKLIARGNVSLENNRFTAMAANGGAVVLGTSAGSLVVAGMTGQPYTLSAKARVCVTEAAVSGSTIAFLAENGTMGFIPLDYNRFPSGRTIPVEQNKDAYNRITAFAAEENDAGEQFIFWQDMNTRIQPLIRSPGINGKKLTLSDITFRSPVRSVVSFGGKILFLDSTGNISVVSPFSAGKSRSDDRRMFTFFSVGLMDAAFIDRNRLIIGRSAISGNTPFLMINVNTGETVPLSYPIQAAVIMYRGSSGGMYAVAVSRQLSDIDRERNSSAVEVGVKTSIVHLDLTNIAASISLVDFQGEDTQFSLAESPGGIAGSLAATIGGEGAAIYSGGSIRPLERTAGLPLKLFDGGYNLISLDGDGNICWYDNFNGKLLAVFRLHPDGWTLQTEHRTISGGL